MSGGNTYGHSENSSRPQATPQEILDLYTKNLPSVLGTTMSAYGSANADNAARYAPAFQTLGNEMSDKQATHTANLIGGEGGRAAFAADELDRSINPEYYQSRNNLADSSSNLIKSFGSMDGLSPGEYNAAERIINQGNTRTGNLGNMSASSVLSNAMNFGQAFRDKQAQFGGAVNTVNNATGTLANTRFNPVNLAMNSGDTSGNFGLGQFKNSANPSETGSSLLTGLFGAGSAPISKGVMNSGEWQAGCCFIFLEATNGTMPWWVRECRDEYYKTEPKIASGYKRMAKWLVPLMQRYPSIKWLVNNLMVIPITKYGGWLKGVKGYESCKKFEVYKNFWFGVWKQLGQ